MDTEPLGQMPIFHGTSEQLGRSYEELKRLYVFYPYGGESGISAVRR
jgi:hypothetical protein